MKRTNLKAIFGAFLLAVILTSCASTPKKTPATLTKTESRAFWRIDGTDKNGNPSTVYIQGTFHLGDERIFPLSDEVQEAFKNADRYAGEISTQGYAELAALGPELNAPNKDGKLVTDHLTDDEKAFVQMAFGQNLPIVDPLEPWQIKTALSLMIYTNTGLGSEYGLDNNFIASLTQMGREWEGLDELQGLPQGFPAISAAWRISQESFLRSVPWINDIRIRAGVGITGNQGFDPGVTTRMYKSDTDPYYVDGRWITVYGLSKNVNYDLQWETKTEYNIGVDWDLFDHRLSGKIDVYKRYVDKLIYDINVAQPPAVYPKTTMNVGSMQNNGIEFELTGVPVRTSDFSYRTTLRGSHNITVLGKLWKDDIFYDTVSFPSPGSPGTAVRLEPGQRVGQFYIWKYAGIDEDGNWLLYDKDDNIIPAAEKKQEDKRYIGNALPDLVLSWDNTVTWKNFDFNMFFRSWIGHDVFNMTEMYYGLPNAINKNVLRSAYTRNAHIVQEKELCDYFIEDGTFLKLDAISAGYTLELGRMVRSIRFSLSGRNLLCLTGYRGIDPEVNTTGLTPGFEGLYLYPDTRVYTLGLQVNF